MGQGVAARALGAVVTVVDLDPLRLVQVHGRFIGSGIRPEHVRPESEAALP